MRGNKLSQEMGKTTKLLRRGNEMMSKKSKERKRKKSWSEGKELRKEAWFWDATNFAYSFRIPKWMTNLFFKGCKKSAFLMSEKSCFMQKGSNSVTVLTVYESFEACNMSLLIKIFLLPCSCSSFQVPSNLNETQVWRWKFQNFSLLKRDSYERILPTREWVQGLDLNERRCRNCKLMSKTRNINQGKWRICSCETITSNVNRNAVQKILVPKKLVFPTFMHVTFRSLDQIDLAHFLSTFHGTFFFRHFGYFSLMSIFVLSPLLLFPYTLLLVLKLTSCPQLCVPAEHFPNLLPPLPPFSSLSPSLLLFLSFPSH